MKFALTTTKSILCGKRWEEKCDEGWKVLKFLINFLKIFEILKKIKEIKMSIPRLNAQENFSLSLT